MDKMGNYSAIKITVIIIVFFSILGNMGSTAFIIITNRIKADIYKIIVIISIS
jgi:hypothetical protein